MRRFIICFLVLLSLFSLSVFAVDPVDVDATGLADVSIQPLYIDDGQTPSAEPGTFKYVLEQTVGKYSPIVVQYAYQSSNGYTNYVREIQPDYGYICACAIFGLVLFCFFRCLGALICKR